jgi:nitrate reductase gamma subunit
LTSTPGPAGRRNRWRAARLGGSNLFHPDALAAVTGHVLGMLIPDLLTAAVGISQGAHHVVSAVAGWRRAWPARPGSSS